MAFTATQKTEAYQFFIVAFGAVPGADYWTQLTDAYEVGNMTTQGVVNTYTTKPQFLEIYPATLSNEEFATKLIANVVGATASDEAKQSAIADVVAGLESGMSKGDVIFNIFSQLAQKTDSEKWGATAKMLANKVQVAEYVTEELGLGGKDLAKLQAYVANVTDDAATVAAAKAAADEQAGGGTEPQPEGKTERLEVGADEKYGTDGNDTFKAYVSQNMLGQQVNTLGSGDYIDGGKGYDTLDAKITAGSFIGGSTSMPIQPETTNVEHIQLQAVWSDVGGVGDQVFVNAKDMEGVQKLSSNYSDASLTVQNLTTNGVNKLSDMTINMSYTGNADSQWKESDFTVYFDQDYLVPGSRITTPTIEFRAMNEDGYDASNGTLPLAGVYFTQLKFKLNGETFDLAPYLGEVTKVVEADGTVTETVNADAIRTYQELHAAIVKAVDELKAVHRDNDALQTLKVLDQLTSFEADISPETLTRRKGEGIVLQVAGETNGTPNKLDVQPKDLVLAPGISEVNGEVIDNSNRYERASYTTSLEVDELLAINVELEKVGLAGDGGQLIIGSMNKTSDNAWDAVNTVGEGTVAGIQQFNVTVKGDASKSSSLSGLHSTNNELRVVNIKTDALLGQTSFANLTIGNSNTEGFALKDVQILDATGFKGNLSVEAVLTNDIVAKYLDRVDTNQADADDQAFQYLGGSGNDRIELDLLTPVWYSNMGSSTREDFSLTIDGGEGDDLLGLDLHIHNWDNYHNQSLMQEENQSVQLLGGAGNDTILTFGSGDVHIDGGEGNDTIDVDHFGGDSASWVLNTYAHDKDRSGENHQYNLLGTQVVITYQGFEFAVDIASATKGVVTDLEINQAIKLAISDESSPLSKLLTAADGQGNSLVVRSLVDGFNAFDLSIQLKASATLMPGDILGTKWTSVAQAQAEIAQTINAFNDPAQNVTYLATVQSWGSRSDSISDNTIVGGQGDDVVILGTGRFSNDTLVFNQADGHFGNDTVVNFNSNAFEYTEWVADAITSFTVSFTDLVPEEGGGAQTATLSVLGGTAIQIGSLDQTLIPGADVAYEFYHVVSKTSDGTYTDENGVKWTVEYADGELTFTNQEMVYVEPGSITADSFVFDHIEGGGQPTVATEEGQVEGTPPEAAKAATFVVDFEHTAASLPNGGTINFADVEVEFEKGNGPITLVEKILAQSAAYADAGWKVEAVEGSNVEVRFTALEAGAVEGLDKTELESLFEGRVPAVVTLTFEDLQTAGILTVGGVSVPFEAATSAAAVAEAVAEELEATATYDGWTFEVVNGVLTATQVDATDYEAADADEFAVTFVPEAATTAVLQNEVAGQASTFTVTFGTPDAGGLFVKIAGQTVEVPEDTTATLFAQQMFAASGLSTEEWTPSFSGGVLTISKKDGGQISSEDVTALTSALTYTVPTFTVELSNEQNGDADNPASFELTIAPPAEGGVITVLGVPIKVEANSDAGAVAALVSAAFANNLEWSVTNEGELLLIESVEEAVTLPDEIYSINTVDPLEAEDSAKVDVPAQVEIEFTDGIGTIELPNLGVTIDVGELSTAAEIAELVANELNGLDNGWTFDAVEGVLTATQDVAADITADELAELFEVTVEVAESDLPEMDVTPGSGNAGINAGVEGLFAGADAVEAIGVETDPVLLPSFRSDALDFSSYNVDGVIVNGELVTEGVLTAGKNYISLVESATNQGQYTVNTHAEAGAADVVVAIGTLDFGATQDFTALNFII